MDKETLSERVVRLETKHEEDEKRLNSLEKENRQWNSLIRSVVAKSVTWLLIMGGSGILFGWHMPAEIRKALLDWAAK